MIAASGSRQFNIHDDSQLPSLSSALSLRIVADIIILLSLCGTPENQHTKLNVWCICFSSFSGVELCTALIKYKKKLIGVGGGGRCRIQFGSRRHRNKDRARPNSLSDDSINK